MPPLVTCCRMHEIVNIQRFVMLTRPQIHDIARTCAFTMATWPGEYGHAPVRVYARGAGRSTASITCHWQSRDRRQHPHARFYQNYRYSNHNFRMWFVILAKLLVNLNRLKTILCATIGTTPIISMFITSTAEK